ncbi:protein spaetzle 5-like isoform X1 [Harmonia axyridis]|uniref:protein spaetzle 5-like isoform X1 n=1 Tax=Harmonia axyridis TaxID=115357 RepID=UPI001E2780D4|nr:protein spaetzle 5-like isoform X1 [Harmonia axyridis]
MLEMSVLERILSAILVISFILGSAISSLGDCSYYGRTCPFLPAPAGKTPKCARPGLTFCEYPDGYPAELIKSLAKQDRYNHRSLVTDETRDEYSASTGPYPAAKYPLSYKGIDITTSSPYYNSGVQGQWYNGDLNVPNFTKQFNQSDHLFNGFGDHQGGLASNNAAQFLRYKYTSNIPHPQHPYRDLSPRFLGPFQDFPHFRSNYLWKRETNPFSQAHERVKRSELLRRFMREIRESPFKKNSTEEVNHKRQKRQDDGLSGETLCRAKSTFIMPRAAMNADGNWLYVVNMEDTNQKYTQLVKTEVCATKTCSSLCGLPLGYTSKCEQKYIQKRLIALQGEGDQLFTDIFWIPSCCVCTIQQS